MSINLGPYSNFHNMNLDWIIKEWYDTKEALIGDQHQWREFKENMTKAWEEYKTATNKGIENKEAKLDAQYNAFTKAINTKINENQTAFDDLKKYCEDYFKNLNISYEIGEKLESMKNDGSLGSLINPTISNEVTGWLNTNITNPLNPPLDKSLSTDKAAAPSYVVGNVADIARTYLSIINNSPTDFDKDLSITDCNDALENGLYTISKSTAKKYDAFMDDTAGNAFLIVKNTPVAGNIIDSLANHDVFQFLVTQHVDKSYHFRLRHLAIKLTGIEGSEENFWKIINSDNFVELFALDTTLTQSGKPADAQSTGNRINAVKSELDGNINSNKRETDKKLEECFKYVTTNFAMNINTSGLQKGVYYFEKASVTDDKFPGVEKDKLVCAWMVHYENEDILHKVHQSLVCKHEISGSSFYKTYHRDFESSNLPVDPVPKWVDENPLVHSVDYNDTIESNVSTPSAKAVVNGMRNIADLSLMAKGADTGDSTPGIYDVEDGVNIKITDSNLNEVTSLLLKSNINSSNDNNVNIGTKFLHSDSIDLTNENNVVIFISKSNTELKYFNKSYTLSFYDNAVNIAFPAYYPSSNNNKYFLIISFSTSNNYISFRRLDKNDFVKINVN